MSCYRLSLNWLKTLNNIEGLGHNRSPEGWPKVLDAITGYAL